MSDIQSGYYQEISQGWRVENTRPEHVNALEKLQEIVFPTLSAEELMRARQYLRHLEIFPEGQFVVTANGELVGMTTTMRTKFDFTQMHHTFHAMSGGGWLSQHDPEGDWLYGLDMGVHPAWRGKGIARALYEVRQRLVMRLGLKGQLTTGMMNGYGEVSASISGEEYYSAFLAGLREDPTLSAQRAIGFEPIGLIPGYVNDPACGGFGVLMRLDVKKDPRS